MYVERLWSEQYYYIKSAVHVDMHKGWVMFCVSAAIIYCLWIG